MASGHLIILFSPKKILVSDKDVLHDVLCIGFESPLILFCFCLTLLVFKEDGVFPLSTVENLFITILRGSTSRAIQVSSGANTIDLGLKS